MLVRHCDEHVYQLDVNLERSFRTLSCAGVVFILRTIRGCWFRRACAPRCPRWFGNLRLRHRNRDSQEGKQAAHSDAEIVLSDLRALWLAKVAHMLFMKDSV